MNDKFFYEDGMFFIRDIQRIKKRTDKPFDECNYAHIIYSGDPQKTVRSVELSDADYKRLDKLLKERTVNERQGSA